MQFDVLGPLRVMGANGSPVALNSVAQRRLMSLLISRAGTVVSADFLAEHLELSGGALRTSVSRLRRVLGFDVLVTAPPGYELRSEDVDARRFEELIAEAASATDPLAARAALEAAVALWRGEAYDEFAYEEWVTGEARRLTELRAGAIEDLTEVLIDTREWSSAIATIEPLIATEPFRDRPRALLMRALADSGRRTDALRSFQSYREYLLDEVGTSPSEEITNLDREIARDHDLIVTGESLGVFLMTDIVGSTRLWTEHPGAMGADLARHDAVLDEAITGHQGVVISRAGDSFVGAFASADQAVAAAVAAQEQLGATSWRLPGGIQARMGIHLGEAQRRGESWYGLPLNEAARMMAVAHGGQIVISEAVAAAVADTGQKLELVDLGEHRLRDLDGTRRLLQVSAPGLPGDFPPLRSMGSFVTTLPAQRTPLIGRDELVGDIRRLLHAHRLVSLIGPGGVGKTRVAIESSGRELAAFPGGIFFVDLTTVSERDGVIAAVAGGVRTTVPAELPAEGLAAHLGDHPTLLVLDNCEHVVADAADLVDQLLAAAPHLKVLATSRERLQIDGEHCVQVPALEFDGPTATGVQLFTERALAADSDFVADEAELLTVAEIARRLDGIPLAIELAAAQIRTLAPRQILELLDQRFRFLKRGSRHAPPRQQTLEGAVAWSYELLDPDEQRAFRHLSICAGPFTLRTAALLLGGDELETADRLDALVSKSLVVPRRVAGRNQGYSYLETLRDYGRRELVDTGEVDGVRAALEAALLPAVDVRRDWIRLVNEYMHPDGVAFVLEDATRRDAAMRALAAGRLDDAAFLFSSCVFYDDLGAVDTTRRLVAPLASRQDELDPMAWRAAVAAKVELEVRTRRFGESLQTSVDMLAILDPEDATRAWFETWRCALITAVAPEAGIAELDGILPLARSTARPPVDFTLSQILGMKATGNVLLRRLEDARGFAEEALTWAPVARESRDQILALLLWIRYLAGDTCTPELQADVESQPQELGLAELCAAPAALAADLSLEDRARRLVAAARRRPANDIPTPFLLAFGFLAVEEEDHERAAELAACSEIYEASTQIALAYLLARVHGWADNAWGMKNDAMMGEYLSPDHEAATKQGVATLADEVDRWERRLSHR